MKSSPAFLKQHALPALICFGVAYVLSFTSLLNRLENLASDELTRIRAHFKPALASDTFALIAIDESSLRSFNAWPWSREVHGDMLQLVGQRKPSVVGWDILFTEPAPGSPEQSAAVDGYVAQSIAASGVPVVLGAKTEVGADYLKPDDEGVKTSRAKPLPRVVGDRTRIFSGESMQLPVPVMARVAEVGFTDTPTDLDGVRRWSPLVVRVGEAVYPTLALRCLMEHWRVEPDEVEVRLGEAIVIESGLARRRIPIDAQGRYRVNYRHRASDFVSYGYDLTVAQLVGRYIRKQPGIVPNITGRILLVGQVAEGLADMGPTPFDPLTPLVLVHANVIDNVLLEDYARPVSKAWIWLGALALGMVGLARFSERGLGAQLAFALGVPAVAVVAAALLWINASRELALVGPLLGFGGLQIFMIARRVLTEQRAKAQIKGMFGSYLSPQLVEHMVQSGEMPRLGGHEVELTAYFSDIQNFSAFSEVLPPERLVELMNEYLTACTDIVQEEGGTLDKYIGDAVVAMFGAPIALPDHAYRACVATLRVQQRIQELRTKWQAEGGKWPELVWRMQSRIGLNTGRAVVGNMGSRSRFNYTMMGDDVNLAARMESGAKLWGAYTMCTEATKRACEQHGGDRVVFRPLGRILVKGRTRPVPIYEIVGLQESVTPQTRECISLFAEGLARYHARDWTGAEELFTRSSHLELNIPGVTPGVSSNPSLIYLDIVAACRSDPPGVTWDGVYVMKEK